MKKVCIVTGTRAEYGLLKPLLLRVNADESLSLQLVVTGSHLVEDFGYTVKEIENDGFKDFYSIDIPLKNDSKEAMAKATAEAISKFSSFFSYQKPDIVVVLGDRYEIFGVSFAAAVIGIPIAHIHGGETTEGAIDEFLRHSITKMSFLHFTSCDEYRKRVIQLGEEPDRVFNVGALGVENIINLEETSLSEIEKAAGIRIVEKEYAIVTFHPETKKTGVSLNDINELVKAMEMMPDINYLITKANADAGGRIINSIWEEEAKKHSNWALVSSLGVKRYLTAVKHSLIVIGNSSSGVIEAPALKVPTVNIGDRQKGRIMCDSIINCNNNTQSIFQSMKKARQSDFIVAVSRAANPFGDGKTSCKILEIIKKWLDNNVTKGNIKSFYDIDY